MGNRAKLLSRDISKGAFWVELNSIDQFNRELGKFFDYPLYGRFYSSELGGTNLLQLKTCLNLRKGKSLKSAKYTDKGRFEQRIHEFNLVATLSPTKTYFEKEVYSQKKGRMIPITKKDLDNSKIGCVTIDLDNTNFSDIQDCYQYTKDLGIPAHLISQTSPSNFHVCYLINNLNPDKYTKAEVLQRAKEISAILGGDKAQTAFEFIKVPGVVSKGQFIVRTELFISNREEMLLDRTFIDHFGTGIDLRREIPKNARDIQHIKNHKRGRGKIQDVAINPGIMMKIAKKIREAGGPNVRGVTDTKLAGYITKELTKLNLGESTAFNTTSVGQRFEISKGTAVKLVTWLKDTGFIEKVYQVYVPKTKKKLNVWKVGRTIEIKQDHTIWTPDKLAEEKPLETGTRFDHLPFWVSKLALQGHDEHKITDIVFEHHSGNTTKDEFYKEIRRLLNNYHGITNSSYKIHSLKINKYNSFPVLVDSIKNRISAKHEPVEFIKQSGPYQLVNVKHDQVHKFRNYPIFWITKENLRLKIEKDIAMGFDPEVPPQPYLFHLVKKYPIDYNNGLDGDVKTG